MTTRPFATVSVDVDPVDLHLEGYGFRRMPADPLVYTRAVPRLLEVFARTGVRATFFLVGRDAAHHGAVIAAIAAAGHEVASHSHTHPFALARLPEDRLVEELQASRTALEQAARTPVIGFRAPNFDLDRHAVPLLARCGYRYDASAYPTPLLLPARLLMGLKARRLRHALRLTWWPFSFDRQPHLWSDSGHTIHEFPVSVTPTLRVPVYHTARYLISERRFAGTLDALARRNESLSYPLHGVDALGTSEDGVDARLARHPGMDQTLERKLALLEQSLAAIAERFELATFRDRLPVLAHAAPATPAAGEPIARAR